MNQEQSKTKKQKYIGATMPFYMHILKDIQAVFIVIGILVTLAVFFPPGLDGKADPFTTPEHIKPEWYFLSGYQLLKVAEKLGFLGEWAPKLVGIGAQGVIGFILFMVPLLDRNPERAYGKRKAMIFAGICAVFLFALLTVWGHFS